MFRGKDDWVAKLCDFGLSAEDRYDEEMIVRYGGTMGWRPREAMFQNDHPLTSGSCQPCDMFAYGLIVWSIFLLRGECPLIEAQERNGVANALASVAIQETEWLSPANKSSLAFVCQSCLSPHPRGRDRQPWRYLKMNVSLARPVRLLEKFDGRGISVRSYIKMDLSPFSKYIKTVESGTQVSTMSPPSLPRDRQWRFKATFSYQRLAERIPRRRKRYLELAESLPGSSTTTENKTGSVDIMELYSRLLQILAYNRRSQSPHPPVDLLIDIYALSCLRSNIDAATWRRAQVSHILPNVVEMVFANSMLIADLTVEILAWLCRGDIGKQEIMQARDNGTDLWHSCYKSFLRLGNPSKPGEVFPLLAHGCNPGDIASSAEKQPLEELTGRPSVFRRFLGKILLESNPFPPPPSDTDAYSNALIVEICNRFHRIATDESILPRTRYFMTGHLPSNIPVDAPTTALHDLTFSFCYAGVEQLIRNGFLVDCLSEKRLTALQLIEARIKYLDRIESKQPPPDAYRIVALLSQHGSSTLRAAITPDFDPVSLSNTRGITLGWQQGRVTGRNRKTGPFEMPIYRESWSGSIIFKEPKFSLFDDRQLALGQRRMIGGEEGQAYYLDLIRFISQEPIVVGNVQRQKRSVPSF